jgi:alginate O-acetyltransferase complex protein AlgI
MAISGLWHGAAWHFVIWGLYHGAGLAALRYYRKWKSRLMPPALAEAAAAGGRTFMATVRDGISVLFTFHFVAVGWIFFYCDFKTAVRVIVKMFGG